MQDLEKDFRESKAESTDQPKSLWQEVYDIGEEFVDFLEQEIGGRDRKAPKSTSEAPRHAIYLLLECVCIQ